MASFETDCTETHGQQNIKNALMNVMDKSELRNDTIANFTSTLFILPWYNTSRCVCVWGWGCGGVYVGVCMWVCVCVCGRGCV